MSKNQKLELTWVGKETELKIEPRILIENPELSNTAQDPNTENMLIHGDNLLALKALESKYAGKVKCIYIDPPYNTGSAFEHYDDNVEHSIWLGLMKPRLEILHNLLKEEGVIFIQIDDNEQAYLKVLCDEIFGRSNFINMICVKSKASSGASGGGEDRRLKKNVEYILAYSKGPDFKQFKTVYKYFPLQEFLNRPNAYKSVLVDTGKLEYTCSTVAGNNDEIRIYEVKDYKVKSVSQLIKETGMTEIEIYNKYMDRIFTLENAQTSIRQRVADSVNHRDGYFVAEYIPISGKNKGKLTQVGFMGATARLVSFLNNLVVKQEGEYYKREKVGTLWDDMSWSSVFLEGNVSFPSGKKPEELIKRIIDMCSDEGDIILDSFLGSGTTVSVAHKMNRKWIGIELGDQAYTHDKARLDGIISGQDKTGITKVVNWQCGGGYKFYELAPTLIVEDKFGNPIINKEYNADMLAAAMALHEGFEYAPDTNYYWKQGKNENAYIFTTTTHLTESYLDSISKEMQEGEYLVIACKSFDSGLERLYKSIKIKKIPQYLLGRCEFGKDNYDLNIVDVPVYDDEEE